MRTLFDKPIRTETTELFFPNKISLEEFKELMSVNVNIFCHQMKNEDKFPEQWVEQFLAWSEIEQE